MKNDVKKRSVNNSSETGSSGNDEPFYLAIGKLRKAHGLRGELLMEIMTDFPEKIIPGSKVYIGSDHKEYKITGRRDHSKGLLITIANVQDRSQAEEFRNLMVFVHDTDVIDLPEDTYYHHQIMGIKVVDEFNVKLGIITEIIETGANDVYVVASPEGKEILIPAIKSVIKEISLEKGILKVELPEWL